MKSLKHTRIWIVALLLLFVHTVGCRQDKATENPAEEEQVDAVKVNRPPLWSKLSDEMRQTQFIPIEAPQKEKERFRGKSKMSDLSEAERKELEREAIQSARVRRRIDSLMYWESNWQEADRKIREVLEANVSAPQSFATEQIAASKMLTLRLFEGELSSDKREAIAYYTELLLKNEHPGADIIAEALQALDGKWSKQQISRAAARTSRLAREYLKINPCRPCLEGTGVSEKMLDARQRRLYMIHHKIPILEEMSKEQG
jgi:hypothetical protein